MKTMHLLTSALLLLSACTGPVKKDVPVAEKRQHIIFPSFDPDFAPKGPVPDLFELSQDYPDTFDVNESHPWTEIDFETDYKKYMAAILSYCLDGNTEVDFKSQDNRVRKWYHAPWLHYGLNGREYHHGLTRERAVPPKEMHPMQTATLENWAVGFYNPPGGYTIGNVWESNISPTLDAAQFPEGTVTFKLLFTAGKADQVPFLKGSKEWPANIYATSKPKTKPLTPRIDSTVRLLQIDIAVKDKRAGATGWVFGTFIYDAAAKGATVWERMVPVGLMWGDDAETSSLINKEGAFINPLLRQTVLNAALIVPKVPANPQQAFMTHQGLGGRLNGPVDNPISSCISCHGKSAVTDLGSPAPMANFNLTRKTFTVPEFNAYFSVIPGGKGPLHIDSTEYNKLDYSLQLMAGIRNFYQAAIDQHKGENKSNNVAPAQVHDLPEVTRDGLKETE